MVSIIELILQYPLTLCYYTVINIEMESNYDSLLQSGVDLFLALASGTGNLRNLPVRKRTYLPQFLGGNMKHKTRGFKEFLKT